MIRTTYQTISLSIFGALAVAWSLSLWIEATL